MDYANDAGYHDDFDGSVCTLEAERLPLRTGQHRTKRLGPTAEQSRTLRLALDRMIDACLKAR